RSSLFIAVKNVKKVVRTTFFIATFYNSLYDLHILNNGCEIVKKQTNKRKAEANNKIKKNKVSNKVNQIEEYRKKAPSNNYNNNYENPYRNPYATKQNPVRTRNENPYRNQYNNPYTKPEAKIPYNYQSYDPRDYEVVKEYTPEERRKEIKSKNKLTRKEILKMRQRKRNLFFRKLVAIGIVVLFTTYGTLKIVDMMRYPSISYQVVQTGIIDNGEEIEGIIVRDEIVEMSKQNGNVHYIIGEGEKVAKNGSVCFVADDEKLDSALKDLATLDENLYNAQDKRTEVSYYQAELHQINTEIKEEMNRFYTTRYWNAPNELYTLRKQLERVIQERTMIYANDKNELTEALQNDRQNEQEQIKTYQSVEKAKVSGVISYSVDGFEKLNDKSIAQLKYDDYKNVISNANQFIPETTVYGQEGQPLYKVIKDEDWKIVTYLPIEDKEDYEIGTSYEFYFKDSEDKPISFTLKSMTEENEYIKCVFSATEKMSNYLGLRHVQFAIGQNKAEGLKIPIKAIVENNIMAIPTDYIVREGEQKGVYRQVGQETNFVPINIQYTEEDSTYILQRIDQVQSIQLGDIISHPSENTKYTLSEIKSVQGVYVINSSFAKFKPIKIKLTNEEYAILTNDKSTALNEFDQIISNPQKIHEDQLLKYMDVKNN
ncbi:MAG: HlyD family efflux transporter periplasmic adaptor subunit, partial [Cellulosilyticaceae bacterium]